MKISPDVITGLLFFIAVNTSYFWAPALGVYAFPAIILLIAAGFLLLICFLWMLSRAVFHKFNDRSKNIKIFLLAIILGLTTYFPGGIIDFERFGSSTILIGSREGAANCTTTIRLKKDSTFTYKSVCFGIEKTSGKFRMSHDTVYFYKVKYGREGAKFYEFAVEKSPDSTKQRQLIFFNNKQDSVGLPITIEESIAKSSR